MSQRRTPEYIRLIITVIAGLLTVALTGIAFWLSYEHLHDVAALHGLGGVRAWAWPATLDTFIVIGETLILRASLMRTVDKWAIFLTIVGSVGSIVLNVTGVGADGDALDYTVAAVPPVAALLAFGILMRQLHEAITAYMNAGPVITPGARTVPPGELVFDDSEIPFLRPASDMAERIRDEEAEEISEPGPDAMTYRRGDEDGLDADLDSLRQPVGVDLSRMISETSEAVDAVARDRLHRVAGLRDETVEFSGIFTAPAGTPEPDTDGTPPEPWRDLVGVVPDMPDVPPVHVPGVPDNGGFFTVPDVRAALSRDGAVSLDKLPVSPGTGRDTAVQTVNGTPRRPRGSGITAAVRDMLDQDGTLTNEDLRAAFPDKNPESVRKSINRVRKERGE